MKKLDAPLQIEFLRWRHALRGIEDVGLDAGEKSRIKNRSVDVFVTFSGDVQKLVDRGMKVGSVGHGVATGEIALSALEAFTETDEVIAIALSQPLKAELDRSVPEIKVPAVWSATPGFTGNGVIVGIIDSGIDIFHGSFRQADLKKTRILRLWDQKLTPEAGEHSPAPFGFGVEFLPADIEPALAQDVEHPGTATFRHVDKHSENGKQVETEGHGTHVSGIAAGDGSQKDGCSGPFKFVGVAKEADIVFVARGGESRVLDALRYIFAFADSQHKAAVVNMSFGWNLGAHDGTGNLETQIDQLLQGTSGKVIVKSAGNERANHRHARDNVIANGEIIFPFKVESIGANRKDENADEFEIWYDGAAAFDFTLIPPDAGSTPLKTVSAGTNAGPYDVGARKHQVTVASDGPHSNGKKRIKFTIDASAQNPISLGPWSIKLKEKSGSAATIDIWVDREDTDVYPQFVNPIPENTISSPGWSQSVITVAAYDPAAGGLASFSSLGQPAALLPAGIQTKPDIAAPGVSIMAPNSGESRRDPCCKCCVDYYVHMDGTSMATPHVTGVVALMLQKKKQLTFQEVRTHLQLTARLDGIPSSEQPPFIVPPAGVRQNHIWGSGKINAEAAVNAIVPAVAGGGGGGGFPAPFFAIASPGNMSSFPDRVRRWEKRFSAHPAFHLSAALISTHYDEILRLVNGNRRVATVWRREGGPMLLRDILFQNCERVPLIPDHVAGHRISELLSRLLKLLARFGSEALRADVARYRDFVVAVPGTDFAALDRRIAEGRL